MSNQSESHPDENEHPAPGDCVQINSEGHRYHGCVGRVKYIDQRALDHVAVIDIDHKFVARVNIHKLIQRHPMACDEL